MKAKLIVGGLVMGGAGLVAFIGGWENAPPTKAGYVVYADKLANGLPTAGCSGITKHVTATPVIVGETWSRAKCDYETSKALAKVQMQLIRCFKRLPPQSVFDAATSHAWNVGVSRTCASGAMRAWNDRQWALGCQRLAFSDSGNAVWSYANGRFVQGLQNRRKAERALCEAGI